MMDDPAYAEKNIEKINLYEKNGIISGVNAVFLYETRHQPLDMAVVNARLKESGILESGRSTVKLLYYSHVGGLE